MRHHAAARAVVEARAGSHVPPRTMKTAWTRWLTLPLIAALTGCGDPGVTVEDDALPSLSERGTFALDIDHDDGAFRRGSNSFAVRATDGAGHAGAVVGVSARMPGHTHDTTPPRIDCADGVCRVSDLLLTMPGRWEITLQLVVPGEQDEVLLAPVLR